MVPFVPDDRNPDLPGGELLFINQRLTRLVAVPELIRESPARSASTGRGCTWNPRLLRGIAEPHKICEFARNHSAASRTCFIS